MTSDAAERLSKPTAASLSKARALGDQVNIAKPSPVAKRGAILATRGAASTRGAAAKARGGATVAKARAPAKAAPPPASVEAGSHEEIAPIAAHVEAEPVTLDTSEHHEEAHVEPAVLHDEPEEVQEHHEEAAPEQVDFTEVEAPHEEQVDPAAAHHAEDVVIEYHAQKEGLSLEHDDHEIELPGSPSPTKHHSDDLDDLVSMLEAKKPVQLSGHEDVVAEIPDEE